MEWSTVRYLRKSIRFERKKSSGPQAKRPSHLGRKRKEMRTKILYPANLSFKYQGYRKSVLNMQELRILYSGASFEEFTRE